MVVLVLQPLGGIVKGLIPLYTGLLTSFFFFKDLDDDDDDDDDGTLVY